MQRRGVCIRHGAEVKKRKKCSVEGCTNQARGMGGICIRHGAKEDTHKICSVEGCTNKSRKGGVCDRHGTRPKCSHEGCTNQARTGGVCIRHGTKAYICSSEGCTNKARSRGLCERHANELKQIPEGTIVLPISQGRLGLTLRFDTTSATIVAINPACSFKDRLNVGDYLESIDGVKVTKKEDLAVGKDEPIRMFRFAKMKSEQMAEL